MRALRTILTVALASLVCHAQAQHALASQQRRADALFDKLAYAEARSLYADLAERGATNEHVIDRLAECNVRMGDEAAAAPWCLASIRFLNPGTVAYQRCIRVLDHLGRHDEARRVAEQAKQLGTAIDGTDDQRTFEVQRLRAMTTRFEVRNAGINTAGADIAPTWIGNGRVVFAAPAIHAAPVRYIDGWTGEAPFDLFIADREPNNTLVRKRPLQGDVNSDLNEAGAACDEATFDLYYTANGHHTGRAAHTLHIERARYRGDHWEHIGPLQLDADGAQEFHPTLSKDGRTLYFASDRPGGIGGTDLYVTHAEGQGWSAPRPVDGVNTPGNELFPFVDEDGVLYFSSDGLPGLGGYDVFRAAPRTDGGFDPPVNVGAPLNGPSDETGFIIDRSGKHGYFASDRPGGKGQDDIYAFTLTGAIEPIPFTCAGRVTEALTDLWQPGQLVELLDAEHNVVASTITDESGRYLLDVRRDGVKYIRVKRADGAMDTQYINENDLGDERVITRDLVITPPDQLWLKGAIALKDERQQAEGVLVTLVCMTSMEEQRSTTGPGGTFRFHVRPDEHYFIVAEREGFFTASVDVMTTGAEHQSVVEAPLEALRLERFRPGVAMRFERIAFDDKVETHVTAPCRELDLLAERLQQNPNMRVEVAAVTRADDHAYAERCMGYLRAITLYLRAHGIRAEVIESRLYTADPFPELGVAASNDGKGPGELPRLFYTLNDQRSAKQL